jgi:flavodoxin
MPDTVVVYVTRSGHSRALALDLGLRLGAEVREIVDLVDRKGLFGWIRSGRQASMRAATPIRDPGIDLKAVKTVVLVQPVWASAVCPPLRSWIRAHAKELAGKRAAVLSSGSGTPAADIRAKFEAEFPSELGRLIACAANRDKEDEASRKKGVDDFVAELARE